MLTTTEIIKHLFYLLVQIHFEVTKIKSRPRDVSKIELKNATPHKWVTSETYKIFVSQKLWSQTLRDTSELSLVKVVQFQPWATFHSK